MKLVRETQPNAMLCSRDGHGLGDYESQGDMAVPPRNAEGLWETCETTNDSWAYAWYDQNWKDTKEILHRVVATVGRAGSYPSSSISRTKRGVLSGRMPLRNRS